MNRINKKIHLAVCAALAAITASPFVSVQAATTPEAGQILNQIERDIQVKPLPEAPSIEEAVPVEEDQGPKVIVKQFKFEGNKALSDAELQEALATLTKREISITELKTCLDLITRFYRQKGYLATATLPEQDITEGTIIINIVEAIFGDVKFDGEYNKDFKRVKPSVIERTIGLNALKGKALNQDQLDAGLARAENLAGIKIQGGLQAGTVAGTTDLLVKVKDQRFLTSYLSIDNTGGRQTGRHKATAFLTFASPMGFGETVNLTALHSEGTDYSRLAMVVPVGSTAMQLGANASYMAYDVIANESKAAGYAGYSSSFAVNASYPLFKNKTTKLLATLEAEQKFFTNKSLAEGKTSDYDLKVFSLNLAGDHADNLLAGAINNASLNLGFGDVDLNGSANRADDKAGPHTQGSYQRLRWNLSRNQFLTDTVSLTLSGSGQFANTNLDSSEKFYLGGINGVRAYPTSEGAGSEGYLYVAELRKYLPNNFTVSGFVDHGHVRQYETNHGATGTALSDINTYSLKGYGMSMTWQGPYNTNIKATYAHRMGSNPNQTLLGYDQDGSRHIDVFWLNGSVAF